jgi:ribosomal protein S18 acetylase RimI-like enzyme
MQARAATLADLPALLEMVREFFAWESIPFDAARVAPALRTLVSAPEVGFVRLFEVDRQTIGYAIVSFGFDLEFNGRDAGLTDLYLKPEWRDRGEGKKALDLVVHEAKLSGVHALHLLVDPKNQRAARLYERTGFERSHRVAMTKRLV